MNFLVDESAKQARASLYSSLPLALPDLALTEAIPVAVSRVQPIASPSTPQVYNMLNSAGYTFRVGIGNGFISPVAGSFYLRSGIALTAGVVVTGKRYKIVTFAAGDDFTNIGGTNATGSLFIATGTTPTTWTNASDLQEVTAAIPFNANLAAIQTALNNTAWITTAGGIVLSLDGNIYLITWNNAGEQIQIIGEGGNLAPLSTVDMGELIAGDVDLQEVQSMQISQQPASFVDLVDALPDASAPVVVLVVGGGGLNHAISIALFDDTLQFPAVPFNGNFSIIIAGIESGPIPYNATDDEVVAALEAISINAGLLIIGQKYVVTNFVAGDDFSNIGGENVTGTAFVATGTTPTTWTNGSTISPVGAGNVIVTQLGGGTTYQIAFQGQMANQDMGAITTDASGLVVPSGYSGILMLNVAGVALLLAGAKSLAVTLSIRAIPPGGSGRVIFSAQVNLTDAIFTPGSESPQPADVFVTIANLPAVFAAYLLTLPDGDPHVAGEPWNNGGSMSISLG